MTRIPLSYTPVDVEGLAHVLTNYKDRDHTEIVLDFEKAIAHSTGSKYAILLQSGTAGIHLALKLAGVGPGDTVITSTFTYIASASPLHYLGARPVFIDCEANTWNIDIDLLEEAIADLATKGIHPKAIMIVHNYGNPAAVDRIRKIAREKGMAIIEDAAEAIGSTQDGNQVGNSGLGVISFNNNKINTTFGGSVLLLQDEAMSGRARFLASHARENLPYYEHHELGYNYRMGSLGAAYGLSQWGNVDKNVAARRRIFEKYRHAFSGMKNFGFPKEEAGAISNRWLSTFTFEPGKRSTLEKTLLENSIETRPLWSPLHLQLLFKDAIAYEKGVAVRLFKEGICLPSSANLTPVDQDKVIEIISLR